MKKLLLLQFLFLLAISLSAQVETILFEDFQNDPFLDMDTISTGSNDNWVNYDQDGLETNEGTLETKRWRSRKAYLNVIDTITGESDFVANSLSWLEGSAPGNRNWLILPPFFVEDDSYMFYWESATRQAPRFQDGYQVLISSNGNDVNSAFSDTLFTAASMDMILNNGDVLDYNNYTFTKGYMHGNSCMDSDYCVNFDDFYLGSLEPHSVDLSSYSGQTVYIAFLHDSDDDYEIIIDDILVSKGEKLSAVQGLERQIYRIETYPNPVMNFMQLTYMLDTAKDNVSYKVLKMNGEEIEKKTLGIKSSGLHSERINMTGLSSGTYLIQLRIDGQTFVRTFVKS